MKYICANCLILSDDKKHEDLILDGWTWINAMYPTHQIQMVCPRCTDKFRPATKENDMGFFGGEVPTVTTGTTTKLTSPTLPHASDLLMMRVHFHTPADEDTYDEYDVTEEVYLQVADAIARGFGVTFKYFLIDDDPISPAYFACGPNIIKYID